ncbi:MAG: NAD(P)/FAD-dependent oxidoreductase [Spirosomataceae bacterium]
MAIVIIGNGISGITAARHIRKKSQEEIFVISGETPHFFSRTALMYVYMGQMRYEHTKPYEDSFWEKSKIQLIQDWVTRIDKDGQRIFLSQSNRWIDYTKLILALGSKPVQLGIKNENLKGIQGLYSFQDLELLEARTPSIQEAVLVGGGLIGVELAEMLLSRGKKVTMVVREESFWRNVLPLEESKMISNHLESHGLTLLFGEEIKEIHPKENSVEIGSVQLKSGQLLKADFLGVTIGVQPNVAWLANTDLEVNRGILVNEYLETSWPNVFAVGDCVQLRNPEKNRRAIEQIWYTGRMMGEVVADNVLKAKQREYTPGIFFNSAKFFDIEYQIYGRVPAFEEEGIRTFLWAHPVENKSVRIAYKSGDLAVVGCHSFGIRMRQVVWEDWIQKGKKVTEVMGELEIANFDPEFYKRFEGAIRTAFVGVSNLQVVEKRKKTWGLFTK